MENKRSIVEQGLLTNFLIMIFLIFAMSQAEGQTATITAITGSSCAGTRFGSNLNCTSNDFSSSLTFDQPTATALTSCIAGSTVNLDILAATTSNSPIRYDGAYFIGELGNSPSTMNLTVLRTEERDLTELFGHAYTAYAVKVPRWIFF